MFNSPLEVKNELAARARIESLRAQIEKIEGRGRRAKSVLAFGITARRRWRPVTGAGLRRPASSSSVSAKGVMFITLEDETGIANLVVWAKVAGLAKRGFKLLGGMPSPATEP